MAVRPNGGETRRSDAAQAATIYIYAAYLVAADTRDFMGGTYPSGSSSMVLHRNCMRGPGGEAQAYAISKRATLSVDAELAASSLLWQRWHNYGSLPNSEGKGQG